MAAKKEKFVIYAFQSLPIIETFFTDSARSKYYFIDKNNKLFAFDDGNVIEAPFTFKSEYMLSETLSLYPFGTTITNNNTYKECGEIVSYDLDKSYYILNNKQRIKFKNAVVAEYYYFISSTGKIQKDIVGRDTNVEQFRKATNNYFETKEEANKKLIEINLQISK